MAAVAKDISTWSYSATAFHWIPREIGYAKAAQALKPGGALAVFSNQHPRPYTGFFDEVEPIYRQIVPEWSDPVRTALHRG